MELIIAFIVEAAASWLLTRRKPQPTAVQAEPALSPTLRLQSLTSTLSTVGDASAHPRDVMSNPTFLEAVGFCSQATPL